MRKLSTQELNRLTVEAFKSSGKLPVTVVLDNLRSGHNVGSVFRTCDAFGVSALYLGGITPAPPNREVMKTALGSSEAIHWMQVPDTQQLLKSLRQDQYHIIFAEHTSVSIPLQRLKLSSSKKYALVFGNEVEGINAALLPLANTVVEIPQFGTKHSFNVSVAAGIVLWDVWNKMSAAK